MLRILTLLLISIPAWIPLTLAQSEEANSSLEEMKLNQLEERLAYIDDELDHLAHSSLRSGIGSIGYRAGVYPDSDHLEWIQVDLAKETPIDQIVLVPTIWRDTEEGLINDGFPAELKVIAGKAGDPDGEVIARYTTEDHILPRIAPFVIPCETTAAWVRIEATQLSPRAQDGRHSLQLSEILIFDSQENVALHKAVSTSSPSSRQSHAWKEEFLVDGFMPYLMNAPHGEKSFAMVSRVGEEEPFILNIDLESVHLISSIYLHAVEQSDTVPQSTAGDFGLPQRLLIEGANKEDFSDATLLGDFHWESIFSKGPIIMRPLPLFECRYLRLSAFEPYISVYGEIRVSRIGFAEIEINSHGKNVSRGKEFKSSVQIFDNRRQPKALTDGRNLYGEILPIRDWLNELSMRHELERERPQVASEVQRRYDRQKTNLMLMGWLAALLGVGIAFTILIDRMLRMREVARIRERFAADLHDELGANIHTIGLLGDVAENAIHDQDRLKTALRRIRSITERTGTAVRNCINLQEANGLYGSLPDDMRNTARRILSDIDYEIIVEGEAHIRNTARRILSDIDYEIIVEGEAHISKLKPRDRNDLLLFFKECLVNTSRHADATQSNTKLVADEKAITLTIIDNGCGIPESLANSPPPSLKRRAHLLGAKISAKNYKTGGTCITLNFKRRRIRFRRKQSA